MLGPAYTDSVLHLKQRPHARANAYPARVNPPPYYPQPAQNHASMVCLEGKQIYKAKAGKPKIRRFNQPDSILSLKQRGFLV